METKQPQDTESRHADKYIVRFPEGMRDELKSQAKMNGRTLNAEIVSRLERSLQSEDEELTSEFKAHVLQGEVERLSAIVLKLQEATGQQSASVNAEEIAELVVQKLATRADYNALHETAHEYLQAKKYKKQIVSEVKTFSLSDQAEETYRVKPSPGLKLKPGVANSVTMKEVVEQYGPSVRSMKRPQSKTAKNEK